MSAFRRHMRGDDIPDETFEATLRDAQAIFNSATPDMGFVLLVVKDAGGEWDTRFALSTGRDQIPRSALQELANGWIEEV